MIYLITIGAVAGILIAFQVKERIWPERRRNIPGIFPWEFR